MTDEFGLTDLFEESLTTQVNAPSDAQLKRVADLSSQLVTLEGRIAKGEKLLKELKAEVEQIEMRDLPNAMEGLSSIVLLDGKKISKEELYVTSIPTMEAVKKDRTGIVAERREEAFRWLRDNAPQLVKSELSVDLPRGSEEKLQQLRLKVIELGLDSDESSGVHWKQLANWVKERHENGQPLPEQVGAKIITRAKVV